MRNHLKRGALVATVPVLALIATGVFTAQANATTPQEEARSALRVQQVDSAPTSARIAADSTTTDRKAEAARLRALGGRGTAPGISAAELPAYQKVTACLRANGIRAAEPKVGWPYNTDAMNGAFGHNKRLFHNALKQCPDYLTVVVGVDPAYVAKNRAAKG
jgi:hypothetical protein